MRRTALLCKNSGHSRLRGDFLKVQTETCHSMFPAAEQFLMLTPPCELSLNPPQQGLRPGNNGMGAGTTTLPGCAVSWQREAFPRRQLSLVQ